MIKKFEPVRCHQNTILGFPSPGNPGTFKKGPWFDVFCVLFNLLVLFPGHVLSVSRETVLQYPTTNPLILL